MSEITDKRLMTTEDWSLEEHDRIYHKGGYKQGDKCNVRERLEKSDDPDWMLYTAKYDLGTNGSDYERPPQSGDDVGRYGENSLWGTGRKVKTSRGRYTQPMNDTDREAFELAYQKAKESGDSSFMKAAMHLRRSARQFGRREVAEQDTFMHGLVDSNEEGMKKAIKAFKEARREIGMRKAKKYLDMVGK